ncbi:MAG: hypothetical protein EBY20_04315 [Alphaproteobacteria bacterium]|uniref:Uncharacterized protein n=1 Tax=viral metagenome TaxID=1070528 RepID=A0A6C0HRJ2_9ZZZZ|nr:hypothetical protein [Alphaproteobacteria bacterium]
MKLTKNSELLMSFFLERKCINHVEKTSKTEKILKHLYSDIKQADSFIKAQKTKEGDGFYKLMVTKIHGISQIPKPKSFNPSSFPEEVREHIDKEMLFDLSYTFSLFGREIKVHFIVEDPSAEYQIELYNEYIEKILVWLHIINEYSSKKCSKRLVLYMYFTSLKKALPEKNIDILNQNNVNTAFTYTCPVDSEIVVFRKEEWLKVLMHESFHNFSLDFSDMNTEECTKHILSIFKVKSDVNLFEAYTEFWAEIMNAVFCSFYLIKDTRNDLDNFLSNFDFFINFERTYKFFQMVKTLDFMGLTYIDLISNTPEAHSLRETLYKEKSNVLSYYILTTILMNNYQGFLSWCNTNNLSLLQFKKTETNIMEFCKFIEKNYKTRSLIESVDCMQQFLLSVKNGKGDKKKIGKSLDYILNNMRMTVCELG